MDGIIDIESGISYLPAGGPPLSADIGIINGEKHIWLFDVGNGPAALGALAELEGVKNAVISHFHPDHMGNLDKIDLNEIYLGKNTRSYTDHGTVVCGNIYIDDGIKLHIFPLPSSHAKGSVGLEVNGKYAFLGDGTYAALKGGKVCYNTSVLKDELSVLKSLEAKYFLLSHDEKFIREREEVISELEGIYSRRSPKESYIIVGEK